MREQKADGDGGIAPLGERSGDLPDFIVVQRHQYLAVAIDTLADLEDVALVGQQVGFLGGAVVVAFEYAEPGDPARSAHEDQRVRETARRQHRGARTGFGKHRVGRQRGRVGEAAGGGEQAVKIAAQFAGRLHEPVDDAGLQIVRRRRHLADGAFAGGFVDGDHVGKRAADIHGHGVHRLSG